MVSLLILILVISDGVYVRCLCVHRIVSVTFGLIFMRWKRWYSGNLCLLTKCLVAQHANGYKGCLGGRAHIQAAVFICTLWNNKLTGDMFACTSRMFNVVSSCDKSGCMTLDGLKKSCGSD